MGKAFIHSLLIAAMLFAVSVNAQNETEEQEQEQEFIAAAISSPSFKEDMSGKKADITKVLVGGFNAVKKVGGNDAPFSESCQKAVTSLCPVCPKRESEISEIYKAALKIQGASDPKDICSANGSCPSPWHENCRKCRGEITAECQECTATNAVALIKAGCTHIGCKYTLERVCKSCPTAYSVPGHKACRGCTKASAEPRCVKCVEEHAEETVKFAECRQCTNDNVSILGRAGCPLFKCRNALQTACPDCKQPTQEEEASCAKCEENDTSVECVRCASRTKLCFDCVKINTESLNEVCKKVQTGANFLKQFGATNVLKARVKIERGLDINHPDTPATLAFEKKMSVDSKIGIYYDYVNSSVKYYDEITDPQEAMAASLLAMANDNVPESDGDLGDSDAEDAWPLEFVSDTTGLTLDAIGMAGSAGVEEASALVA